jgi:lipopolysaccharide transport system permease protein
MLTAFVDHRHLIVEMVRRDLKDRYAGSMLGIVWNVIQPLVMIFIYTVIFSRVMGTKFPGIDDPTAYSVYICSGILPWLVFQDIVGRATSQFVSNAPLLQRAVFRKEVLIWVVWISGLITFSITFVIFLLFMTAIDLTSGSSWLSLRILPVYLGQVGCLTVLAAGMGMALSCMNVFFRDTAHLVGVVLQFWFWLTPIVWPFIPEQHEGSRLAAAITWNPLYWYIDSFQQLILYKEMSSPFQWTAIVGLAIAGFFVGTAIMRLTAPRIVDEL